MSYYIAKLLEDSKDKGALLAELYDLMLGENLAHHRIIQLHQPNQIKEEILQSYLDTSRLFPQALMAFFYDTEDKKVEIADLFFTEVHPILSIGALAPMVGFKWGLSENQLSHVWRLVDLVLTNNFENCLQRICDKEEWKKVCPNKEWMECCSLLVQCVVHLSEATTPGEADREGAGLLSRFAQWIAANHPDDVLVEIFMTRFLNRGESSILVKSILATEKGFKSLPRILGGINDPFAKESFCKALIKHARHLEENEALYLLRSMTAEPDEELEYILLRRVLLKCRVDKRTVELLIQKAMTERQIQEAAKLVATTWSNKAAIEGQPIPHQAYITHILTLLARRLPGVFTENMDGELVILLMDGVANRMENCIRSIRHQGMRVAAAIAKQPIFNELQVDFESLEKEEQWDLDEDQSPQSQPMTSSIVQSETKSADSDDESDFCSSVDDVESISSESEVDREESSLLSIGHRPVTLMDVHRDLRNPDEPMKVIKALKQLERLVTFSPRELDSSAGEICKTIMHLPLPEWIHEELKKSEGSLKGAKTPSEVRVSCLTMILTQVPRRGDSLLSLFSSKQTAEYQRLEILESIRSAAKILSSPPPVDHKTVIAVPSDSEKTRVWGKRSIELGKTKKSWRNRFLEVAGLWTCSLLMSCHSGPDASKIMERSHMVLSSVIMTLGSFADCASKSIVSTSIALSSFPLIKSVMEQKGQICHLRRCVLQAVSSLLAGIPTDRFRSIAYSEDESDQSLMQMMSWIRDRAKIASTDDSDETCRLLATKCILIVDGVGQSTIAIDKPAEIFQIRSSRSGIDFKVPKFEINRLQ